MTLDRHSLVEAGQRIFYKTARLMAQRGHDVTLVVEKEVDCGIPIEESGIRVLTIPKYLRFPFLRGGFSPGAIIHRTWLVLNEEFDIIYVNPGIRPAMLFPVVFARLFTRSKIVEEVWEWFGRGGVGSFRRGFMQRSVGMYDLVFERISKMLAHGLVVISSPLKERYSRHRKCVVLHGAVESDLLHGISTGDARVKLGIDQNLIIFGMCSLDAGDQEDNVPALRALATVCRQHSNIRALVTGNKEFIEREIFRILPSDKVIYPGWVPIYEYADYLSSCNYFVLPYPPTNRNLGRWPNKFGDYVLMRRPLITNPTGDIGELCAGNKIGWLCENSESAYEELFRKLIANGECENEFAFDEMREKLMTFEERADFLMDLFDRLAKGQDWKMSQQQ